MEAIWFFGAIVGIILAIDIYCHRHPLNEQEVYQLSRKRQRNSALSKFDFSTLPQPTCRSGGEEGDEGAR